MIGVFVTFIRVVYGRMIYMSVPDQEESIVMNNVCLRHYAPNH